MDMTLHLHGAWDPVELSSAGPSPAHAILPSYPLPFFPHPGTPSTSFTSLCPAVQATTSLPLALNQSGLTLGQLLCSASTKHLSKCFMAHLWWCAPAVSQCINCNVGLHQRNLASRLHPPSCSLHRGQSGGLSQYPQFTFITGLTQQWASGTVAICGRGPKMATVDQTSS